ncbi:MAG TPA: hypothetical protein VFX59_25135 [Polyangiales bacterium]|nr:hypothetical protein [Polyangiales bacterium]
MNELNIAESNEIETLSDEQLETVDGGDIWGNFGGGWNLNLGNGNGAGSNWLVGFLFP